MSTIPTIEVRSFRDVLHFERQIYAEWGRKGVVVSGDFWGHVWVAETNNEVIGRYFADDRVGWWERK